MQVTKDSELSCIYVALFASFALFAALEKEKECVALIAILDTLIIVWQTSVTLSTFNCKVENPDLCWRFR